ncbi:MAG: penicillin-binding protein 2, partial [Alistipes sp.]|nr:penicillin-binding protein 2 [Alistipes sp.]
MNGGVTTSPRSFVVRIIVAIVFTVLLGRLIYIQLIDESYGNLSDQIQYRDVVVHPPRGEIYDRNGELLAQNRLCYDVSIIRRDMSKEGFDTVRVAALLNMTPEALVKSIKASPYRVEKRISTYPISVEEKLLLDELNVAGLYTSQRTVRQYPRKIGGNLLGSISEVPEEKIRQDESYSVGDYIGREGLELAYEGVL